MKIPLEQIKKLRSETNVSIASCNTALQEAKNNYEMALDLLRKKGTIAVEKKANRTLGAGIVKSYIHNNGQIGSLVLLLSETDFVSKNEDFVKLAHEIALHATALKPRFVSRDDIKKNEYDKLVKELKLDIDESKPDDVKKKILDGKIADRLSDVVLLEQKYVKDESMTINDLLTQATQKFGEKIKVESVTVYSTK